jgi:hypothetical protein
MLQRIVLVLGILAVVSSADQSKIKWSALKAYDSRTQAGVVEDLARYRIHACEYFAYQDTATLNSGDSLRVTIKAPADSLGKYMHIVFTVIGDGAIDDFLHKNSGGVSGGTAVTPYNPAFSCTDTSIATVTKNPTITTVGTLVAPGKYGATGNLGGAGKIGGGARSYFEYNLAPDSTYTVRIISRSASNRITFSADWYEVRE